MLSVALFSEAKTAPMTWSFGEALRAVALFGSAKIDLRRVSAPGAEIAVSALALFGGVELIVPPGTVFEDSECFAIFGSAETPNGGAGAAERPPLRVQLTALALFGCVNVKVRAADGLPGMGMSEAVTPKG